MLCTKGNTKQWTTDDEPRTPKTMDMTLVTILAVFMIGLGIGFIYFIVRENERPLPKGGVQWAAVVLSGLLVVFSGFLLALTLVPTDEVALSGEDPHPSEMDKPAENFAFRLIADDTEHDLAAYEGKVVLLNLWATWCAPCITELPDLDRLQKNYKGDGLVVLTISDESPDVLRDFGDLIPEATVTGYVDEKTMPDPFRRTMLAGRPVTYVIDREGYVRRFVKGAGTYTFFERLVQPYLGDTLAVR